jgi:dCTP deaminase
VLLSDGSILRRIHLGQLGIDPFDPTLVQPSSVDMRLSHEFIRVRWQGMPIDPARDNGFRYGSMETPETGRPFELAPGEFALGATMEAVALPGDLAARLEGKSSLGRLGLAVHVTAGFIDPGFCGQITLELVNHAPDTMLLWPGMKIGQLCVFELNPAAVNMYGSTPVGSHYQGQSGPQPSRSHEGFTRH